MLTIHGSYRSRASRALWLLLETETPFVLVPVIQAYRLGDPQAPDAPANTAQSNFLALNPMGQIPVMVEDDLILTESLAIAIHLARRHGGSLGPMDWAEDAKILNWALLAATAVESPALDILNTHGKGLADTPAGQALIAERLALLARPFARIEAHLARRDWLVGDRFTVADICLAECVRYAMPQPGAFEPWPNLQSWLERCHARPAFQTFWARRAAEPA